MHYLATTRTSMVLYIILNLGHYIRTVQVLNNKITTIDTLLQNAKYQQQIQ